MPSTSRLLDVYVSLTRTNGARCKDRRGTYPKTRQGGQAVSKRVSIHTSGPSACCDVSKAGNSSPTLGGMEPRGEGRYKNSPDIAKPLRAADIDCNKALCRLSINLATTLQRLISNDTAFGSLPQRTKYPDVGRGKVGQWQSKAKGHWFCNNYTRRSGADQIV